MYSFVAKVYCDDVLERNADQYTLYVPVLETVISAPIAVSVDDVVLVVP